MNGTSNLKTASKSKSKPMNGAITADDDNWKLLKFLCDRIEENRKKQEAAAKHTKVTKPAALSPSSSSSSSTQPKPIPLTTDPDHLLAKRKKKKNKSFVKHNQLTRSHSKSKSQALYTGALPAGHSNAQRHSYHPFNAQPPPNTKLELHHKSQSHRLPQQAYFASVASPPSPSSPISPSHSSHTADAAQPDPDHAQPVSIQIDGAQHGAHLDAADSPLSDPVSSLVTLVRRVTKIYTKMDEENEENVADDETIKQVYDKYVAFYHRPPLYPDHLRKFANKFQGIHVTYAAAKSFLENVAKLQEVSAPKSQMEKMRLSRSSISSPVLFGKSLLTADEARNSKDNLMDDTLSININELHDMQQDNNNQSARNSLKSPTFEFYNMSDLELLHSIKKKINAALHNSDDIESAIHMVWEREYGELEKRLHRAYLHKPYAHYMSNPSSSSLYSTPHQMLKRDRTFLSLKHMSESTDVDDQDHDAAVFLLNTYFPDDEHELDHDPRLTLDASQSLSVSSPTHAMHRSVGGDLPGASNENKLKIKLQQQHIRSVTADKGTKPSFYRRATAYNAQTEALSLYDTMVMKARQTKISSQKFINAPLNVYSLKPHKSMPTPKGSRNVKKSKKPKLETIPSQHSDKENSDEEDEQQHTFKLEDEDMAMRSEMSPEPPLFDPAFRQLTTLTHDTESDMAMEQASIDLSTVSMSKQSSANKSSSTSYTNNEEDNAALLEFRVPHNLLSVMAKYGENMERWDFDVFAMMNDPLLAGKGLVFASFFLLRKTGLLEVTGVAQANLWRFLESVQAGYRDNPYHNKYHAVDVLLSTHFMFQSAFFKKHMTIWDQLGAYIAALCHDLGHMALNNNFYINTAGNLALLYGDESVLENYHIAETFRILNDADSNWMLSFPSSVRRYLATVIKRSILATDLKVHGPKMIQLQNMVDTYKNEIASKSQLTVDHSNQHELMTNHIKLWRCESVANYASLDNIMLDAFPLFMDDKLNDEWTQDALVKDLDIDEEETSEQEKGKQDNEDDAKANHEREATEESLPRKPRILGVDDERIFLLEITIHAMDVANPTKPIFLGRQWAERFLREAFDQGDQERDIGIPVSAGMDRFTTKLPNSQIGFITFVVKRLFQLYAEIVDVSAVCVDTMLQNEQYWIQEKQKMSNKPLHKKTSMLQTINESSNTDQ